MEIKINLTENDITKLSRNIHNLIMDFAKENGYGIIIKNPAAISEFTNWVLEYSKFGYNPTRR